MQNQGLRIHSDKIWGDKHYQNLFGQSTQLAKIFGILEKKLSLGVRSPCVYSFLLKVAFFENTDAFVISIWTKLFSWIMVAFMASLPNNAAFLLLQASEPLDILSL